MPNTSTPVPQRPEIPRVVVVTPVYNEVATLGAYAAAVTAELLQRSDYRFEVLLIDDGSTDASWQLIGDICAGSPRFRGIRLSRNYGAHLALNAWFAQAEGDAVATLACDLQDPPGVILEFLDQWKAGADVVWGRRASRDETWWRVFTSGIFERLIRRHAMPPGSMFTVGSFLLIDRRVVECLRQFQEQNRVTFALVAWTGFSQAVVHYHRRSRLAGVSGWTYGRMVKTMYDTFIGFSPLPIRLMTIAGMAAFLLTIPLGIYLILGWLTGRPQVGWTSLMLVMVSFFGVQLLLTGVLGEYLYRIYAEVVRRPLYFVTAATPPAHDDER